MEEIIEQLEKARKENKQLDIEIILKKGREKGIDPPGILREIIKRNLQNTVILGGDIKWVGKK